MIARPTLVASLVLALGGCVLETDKPLFTDADGQLILGTRSFIAVPYHPDPKHPGQWLRDADRNDRVKVTAVGGHYVLTDLGKTPGPPQQVIFVPLQGSTYVAQLTEPTVAGSGAEYAFAEWTGKVLTTATLACDQLGEKPGIAALVVQDQEKGNCHPAPDQTDARAFFHALLPFAPEPDLRIVPPH